MNASFTCPACGLTTFNATHIRMLHCVACHRFLRDWSMMWCLTMSEADLSQATRQGYLYGRTTPDDRFFLAVERHREGSALLMLRAGKPGPPEDRWTYASASAAIVAAAAWDPTAAAEPFGWEWHAPTQRRRPFGNPALQEFVHAGGSRWVDTE